ncbi:MAG: hypothetical protein ACRBB6_12675 [Neptuniibacter sp.]
MEGGAPPISESSAVCTISFIYLCVAVLVSLHFSYQHEKGLSWNVFSKYFLSSLVAIAVLPLFLNSIGNPVLKNILTGQHSVLEYFELAALAAIASLASKKIIEVTLDSLKLSGVKQDIKNARDEIENTKKSMKSIVKEQSLLQDRQVEVDKKSLNTGDEIIYKNLLTEVSTGRQVDISINDDNRNILRELEEKRYINCYGSLSEPQVSCSITRLGKRFLDKLD